MNVFKPRMYNVAGKLRLLREMPAGTGDRQTGDVVDFVPSRHLGSH